MSVTNATNEQLVTELFTRKQFEIIANMVVDGSMSSDLLARTVALKVHNSGEIEGHDMWALRLLGAARPNWRTTVHTDLVTAADAIIEDGNVIWPELPNEFEHIVGHATARLN